MGPAQWSVNEECGLLVDGFDTPPVVMMPHGQPAYQAMIEAQGFAKATDMFAFQAELAAGYPRPKMTQMMVKSAERNKDVTIRPMRPSKFMEEVEIVMGIFNDAWSENWGFVPFSDKQIEHMAKEIKPIMFKEGLWVGEYKGEPIAYIWMIPDLNEAIRDLHGSLFPFGWAKLLWRLKVSGVKQARIPLMGLRKEFHNTRTGLSIVASLCETVFEAGRKKGFSVERKAIIPINGKPMIDYVLDALSAAKLKSPFYVSGFSAEYDKRLTQSPTAPGPAGSAYAALTDGISFPCLVTTCDHPLLTRDMLDIFVSGAQTSGADFCVGFAEKSIIQPAYPDVKRTYWNFSDRHASNLLSSRGLLLGDFYLNTSWIA